MAIQLTEEDICGFDVGSEVATGDNIVYESNGVIHDEIKEMRHVQEDTETLKDDTRASLERIEKELLSLNIESKSSKEYHRIHKLYRTISDIYNKGKAVDIDDEVKLKEEDMSTVKLDSSFDYVTIQRLTKLEDRISRLEDATGFEPDNLNEDTSSPNIILRINKLYAHLKLLNTEMANSEQKPKCVVNELKKDQNIATSIQTVRSFEEINKYSPYMDHIITRLENYSSIYDDMTENNLRLQEWDNKINAIIRQQSRWMELLDQINENMTKE